MDRESARHHQNFRTYREGEHRRRWFYEEMQRQGARMPYVLETEGLSAADAVQYAPDPYAQLQENRKALRHHRFDDYAKPLPTSEEEAAGVGEEELGARGGPSHRAVEDPDTFVEEREAWRSMKRSPVESRGLEPVQTSNVAEPSADPELVRAARDRDREALVVPKAAASELEPIKVDRPSRLTTDALKRYKADREAALGGVDMRSSAPPPESIHCGWSEYQGGATWEDINRYREWEMRDLRQTIQQQQHDPVYYYY